MDYYQIALAVVATFVLFLVVYFVFFDIAISGVWVVPNEFLEKAGISNAMIGVSIENGYLFRMLITHGGKSTYVQDYSFEFVDNSPISVIERNLRLADKYHPIKFTLERNTGTNGAHLGALIEDGTLELKFFEDDIYIEKPDLNGDGYTTVLILTR